MTKRAPGLEHPMHFAQPAIEIGDVPNAERDDRAGMRCPSAKRKVERVGDHRRHDRRPAPCRAGAQHRLGEVGADDAARETRARATARADTSSVPAQRSTYVPVGARSQLERSNRAAPPRLVDVEAEEMVEEIVPRRDLREDPLHVRALCIAAGGRRLRFAPSPTR